MKSKWQLSGSALTLAEYCFTLQILEQTAKSLEATTLTLLNKTVHLAPITNPNPNYAVEQRLTSSVADKLRKDCDAYTQFIRENPENNLGKELQKLTCTRYQNYINTGKY